MNRKINKEEIQSIINVEKEDAIKENFLDLEEIEDYLSIIREEMEYCWTYEQYLIYWNNR